MSSKIKNYLIALLAAATLCTALIAWNQSRQVAALQLALASAEARLADAKSTRTPSDKPAPAVASAPSVPVDRPPPVALPAPEPGEDPAPNRNRSNRSGFAALMANPEFAQAMNLQQRAALDARYADLFKKLNLPPATLERLKDLLVERQTARMDVMLAARETGLNPRDNREEIQKLVDQAHTDVDANIKAAIGDAAFNQYKTYETTQPQRTVVSSLDQRLAYSGTPLSPAQSDFLVQALSPTDTADTGGMPGPGGWSGGGRATITDELLQKARSVLSPDQLAALTQLKAEQDAQQKMRELMRNGGGGPRN